MIATRNIGKHISRHLLSSRRPKMSFSGTIGTGTGSKSLQELSTGELVEGLSRKQNPATSFFDLEEPQQRSALSHLFDKYRWDQQLKQSLDFHERRCPAADATICMSWASGRRIRNPDDYIDPEDVEGLEGDDSDDEFPIGPCPPDNGYLLKARMVNQWKYVSFQSDDADDPWSVEARWTMMDLWRESRHAPMKVCSPNMPEGKNCAALSTACDIFTAPVVQTDFSIWIATSHGSERDV